MNKNQELEAKFLHSSLQNNCLPDAGINSALQYLQNFGL